MRLTLALLAHELRIQWRSLRFRVVAALYLAIGCAPAILTFLRREAMPTRIGAATYPAEILTVLPLATLVLSFVLALDGLVRERHEGSWETLSVAPFASAGWVLRRFLSLWLIVVALGALPFVLGVALAFRAGNSLDLVSFLVPWLARIVPIGALGVAVGLFLGALGDGALPGVALALILLFWGGVVVEKTVGRWGLEHGLSERWFALWNADHYGKRLIDALLGRNPRHWWETGMPFSASEAPRDPASIVEPRLGYVVPCLALAALALALAPRFLRRTRRDRRPWRVGERHPLRSFVALAVKLRDRYAPDPRPAPRTRRICILLLVATLASYGGLALRALEVRDLGRERYRAEAEALPAVTPLSVVPDTWRVRGALNGRSLDLSVDAELRNEGEDAVDSIAFQLQPAMALRELESPGGTRWIREWDRLTATLQRPLEPGESRVLRFRLVGRPAEPVFPFRPYYSFHQSFGRYVPEAGVPFFLAHGWLRPLISPTWTALEAGILFPRLRYTPWELTRVENAWESGAFVPEELVDPVAELEVDLEVGNDALVLADACGENPVGGHLTSRCRIPLGSYLLAGGGHFREEGIPEILVFRNHRPAVAALRQGLADAGSRMAAAWPGSLPVSGLRVLEVPFGDAWDVHPWGSRLWQWEESVEESFRVRGRLLLLGEKAFAVRKPLESEVLAASFLASWLLERRPPAPEEAFLQPWVLRTLARRRLAPRESGTAVLPATQRGPAAYAVDLTSLGPWTALRGERRLDSLLAHLESRVGPTALREAVDSYLGKPGSGRIEELFQVLAASQGEWVLGFYGEFFQGTAVPHLSLDRVAFRRGGDGWVATGRVVNEGDGSQLCPVTLTTEISPVTISVEVPSQGAASFRLESPYRPQTVFLDPEEACVRYRSLNPRDRVDFGVAYSGGPAGV